MNPLNRATDVPATQKASAGRCPLGFDMQPNQSVFVEKASESASQTPMIEGDPAAAKLLQSARNHIYHWPEGFKGFEADLDYIQDEKVMRGKLIAHSSRSFSLGSESGDFPKWVNFQIEEFLAHREHPDTSQMQHQGGIGMGNNHPLYGQRVDFLGDEMESYYRLKDEKITQINRTYGGHHFVINIDAHAELAEKRFAATSYTAIYRKPTTQALVKTETYLDRYINIEGIALPQERRYTLISSEKDTNKALIFSDWKLL